MPDRQFAMVRNRTTQNTVMVRNRTMKMRPESLWCEIAPRQNNGAISHLEGAVVRNRTIRNGKHTNEISVMSRFGAKSHHESAEVRNRTMSTARFGAKSHHENCSILTVFC